MDSKGEFLNYIYQNTKMGMESTDEIINNISDKQTLEHLRFQRTQYEKYNKEAYALLHNAGYEEKDINLMQKVMSKSMIDMKTMMDDSPAHIAEMMIQGSAMGITDIIKNMAKYQDVEDAEINTLAQNILKLEEDSLEQWKKYLRLAIV